MFLPSSLRGRKGGRKEQDIIGPLQAKILFLRRRRRCQELRREKKKLKTLVDSFSSSHTPSIPLPAFSFPFPLHLHTPDMFLPLSLRLPPFKFNSVSRGPSKSSHVCTYVKSPPSQLSAFWHTEERAKRKKTFLPFFATSVAFPPLFWCSVLPGTGKMLAEAEGNFLSDCFFFVTTEEAAAERAERGEKR